MEYFLHYLAPAIVGGLIMIFCFWLGVYREKRKEKKNLEIQIKKEKEIVALSLWEIGIYARKNKEAISMLRIEPERNQQVNIGKEFLIPFSIDFYTITRNSNFFDFDYKLKSDFLLLKSIIIVVNELIVKYNELHGEYVGDKDTLLTRLIFNGEQIVKSCNDIWDIYTRIIVSEYLAVPLLKHMDLLEEMKKKVQKLRGRNTKLSEKIKEIKGSE